ncbi:MAG: hypothetical protein IKR19_07880 [Acholeplasmatales bacterium]|nr:hypothetical protein [Acholeplasmatales bacterium]
MNIYGNYIEESTSYLHIVTEEEILAEGVGIDLYTKFKSAKKYYREQKFNLEEALKEGDIKEAKSIIKETVSYLTKVGQEIKAIDDSEFSSKVSIFAIQSLDFLARSIGEMLVAGGSDVFKSLLTNAALKNANSQKEIVKKATQVILKDGAKSLTAKQIAKSAGIAALLSIAVPLYKEIKKQMETHEKMQFKINREMRKNHKTEEEAKKAVGTIYKNEILDYISDIIYDLKKLDSGLKV